MKEKLKIIFATIVVIGVLASSIWHIYEKSNEDVNKNVQFNLNKQAVEHYTKMLKDSGADKDPSKILTYKAAPSWNSDFSDNKPSITGKHLKPKDILTNEDLSSLADDINKTLPTVNAGIRLDSIQAGDQTLQYNTTLLDNKNIEKSIQSIPTIRNILVPILCRDEMSGRILNAGIRLIYNYRSLDGLSIGVITISNNDCTETVM